MGRLTGITRFRVEAKADTKQDVIDKLDDAFIAISKALREKHLVGTGEWECMDDVTVAIKSPGYRTLHREEDAKTPQRVIGYSGRRVFTFRPYREPE